MTTSEIPAYRVLESLEDWVEARCEAIGFIFHGLITPPGAKKPAGRAGTNLLHFARCGKLEKAGETEVRYWFRSIKVAKQHLDDHVGPQHWKWCKICEREITQKILNER